MNLVDAIVGIFTSIQRRHLATRQKKIEAAADAHVDFVADVYWNRFNARMSERFAAGQQRLIGGPVKK